MSEVSPGLRPFGLRFLIDVGAAVRASREEAGVNGAGYQNAASGGAASPCVEEVRAIGREAGPAKVLIISDRRDPGARAVCDHFRSSGVDHVWLDRASFPTTLRCSFSYPDNRRPRYSMHMHRDRISLEDVTTVWYQSCFLATPPAGLEEPDSNFATREGNHLLDSLPYLAPHARWINPVSNAAVARHKPYQLSVASAAGLRVPQTLITNNCEDALRFMDAVHGRVVYKSLVNYSRSQGGRGLGLYTTLVNRADLVEAEREIALAPCIFQEFIEKAVDVRILVIGEELFTMHVYSQERSWATVDWRAGDIETLHCEMTELPPDIAAKVKTLMKRLGLVFGCVDMVVGPNDEYIFLEVNPNGQWLWMDNGALPSLTRVFANFLVGA